jgi:uncharacterized protein
MYIKNSTQGNDFGLEWDEAKRDRNLAKHGLDFSNAAWVLESPWRMDITVERCGQLRTMSFAYAFERLCVLVLVHADDTKVIRVVSFRVASQLEREAYREWIANEFEDQS